MSLVELLVFKDFEVEFSFLRSDFAGEIDVLIEMVDLRSLVWFLDEERLVLLSLVLFFVDKLDL